MKFGEILRALLEERNITQKQLATDLNIAPSTIGGYAQNSSEPDFRTLKLLAEYFGVTTDYLLDYQAGNTDNHDEDEILRIFRSLTAVQKTIFAEQGRVFIRHNERGDKISKVELEIEVDNKA